MTARTAQTQFSASPPRPPRAVRCAASAAGHDLAPAWPWRGARLLLAGLMMQCGATLSAQQHGNASEAASGATEADAAADTGVPAPPSTAVQLPPQDTSTPDDGVPRWLDAVRAQRQALQERRRAQHQARRRAIDPIGTARQEALEQEFLRRRREMRDLIEQERWLFLNFGPWLRPWPAPRSTIITAAGTAKTEATDELMPPASSPSELTPSDSVPSSGEPRPAVELPDWDNGWYFRGW